MSKVIVQWFDRANLQEKTASPDNPLPTAQYILDGSVWRPLSPTDLGGGGSGTKIVGVGDILSGTVDPNSATDYPKLIEPSGATAIEIQCPEENVVPLLVSNSQTPFGSWEVYPGTSKVFYYDTLYVSLPDGTTDAQNITFMAVSQQ